MDGEEAMVLVLAMPVSVDRFGMVDDGLVPIGTSGSRRLSRVGRCKNLGGAAPYVIYINSSAGNITYIPGPNGSFRCTLPGARKHTCEYT